MNSLEMFFSKTSFVFLFFFMLASWTQLGFKIQKPNFALWCCGIANLSLTLFLSFRWKESGHFPLSNLYESLMFLSWSFTFMQLFLERLTKQSFLGALVSPVALLTNTFASFSLPDDMKSSSSLVPALQSNWLVMHVTVMILSYAALILGSLISLAFLVITWNTSQIEVTPNALRHDFVIKLDNISYRILGLGFPLLTIGILSGAVWANEAWGSYWSWDPKETWALLTWLVFAIYLHTRLNKGWQGKKPAWIATFGFFMVWMCFLGVNLLGEGLHSYGWLTNT